jgi:hypothetical protein
MRAFGWDDLDLGHGYHEQPNLAENDRVRFTRRQGSGCNRPICFAITAVGGKPLHAHLPRGKGSA